MTEHSPFGSQCRKSDAVVTAINTDRTCDESTREVK